MYDWIGKKRRGAKVLEDEVTSCVFGPLRFMQPAQAWASCLLLLGAENKIPHPGSQASRVSIEFWPKFKRDDGQGHHVEPDAHILAWQGDELIATLLIETKWGASLGINQLLDQWRFICAEGYEAKELRDRSWHLYLSLRPLRDRSELEQQKAKAAKKNIEWGDRLITRSWHQVATELTEATKQNGPKEVWRNDLLRFLSAQGVIPFDGFRFDRIGSTKSVTWHIEKYSPPLLAPIGPLKWRLDEGHEA